MDSLTDLETRMNVSPSLPSKSEMEKFYRHAMSSGDFFVALADKKIIGFSGAIIRDTLWFLSAFWVLPSFQKSGIGFSLLERVYEKGVSRGASVFCVYSSSDFPALASYMKMGMFPGYPVFYFEGTPKRASFSEANSPRSEELQEGIATELDLEIRGVDRLTDHRYWKSLGSRAVQIEIEGTMAGYYYVREGFIGPVVSKQSKDMELLLNLAIKDAVDFSPNKNITLMVPGINHLALKWILKTGFRIRSTSHFLTSKKFGNLTNYLPSGPGLY
ncbi:MAG: GNAT family N-acetyltransferase [Candidatus Heimdallarchaeota archaeon]